MKNLLNAGLKEADFDDTVSDPIDAGKYSNLCWERSDRGHIVSKMFYRYLHKFIDSRVGKSYNRAKNDFVNNAVLRGYPRTIWGESLEKRFEDQFEGHSWNHRYCDYYIKDGVIKKNPPRHKKKKAEVIVEYSEVLYYLLDINKVAEFDGLYDILMEVLGWRFMDYLKNERLSAADVKKVKENLYLRDRIMNAIVETNKSRKLVKRGWYTFYRVKGVEEILDDIFITIKSPGKTLKHSDPQYKKILAKTHYESVKKIRKIKSKSLRDAAHQAIYDSVMEKAKEAKLKEKLNDIINRDRFGFDEESFKGEFYHGQKRKKIK